MTEDDIHKITVPLYHALQSYWIYPAWPAIGSDGSVDLRVAAPGTQDGRPPYVNGIVMSRRITQKGEEDGEIVALIFECRDKHSDASSKVAQRVIEKLRGLGYVGDWRLLEGRSVVWVDLADAAAGGSQTDGQLIES